MVTKILCATGSRRMLKLNSMLKNYNSFFFENHLMPKICFVLKFSLSEKFINI